MRSQNLEPIPRPPKQKIPTRDDKGHFVKQPKEHIGAKLAVFPKTETRYMGKPSLNPANFD